MVLKHKLLAFAVAVFLLIILPNIFAGDCASAYFKSANCGDLNANFNDSNFTYWSPSLNSFTATGSLDWNIISFGGNSIYKYTDSNGITWRAHVFTSSGTFTVTRATAVDVLVVAGGGGGGKITGGGGGAGGLIYSSSYNASGNITVTVGAGGVGTSADVWSEGQNGQNTLFGDLNAVGGGGGGGYNVGNGPLIGGSGGGGAGQDGGSGTGYTGASGTVGQGNSGGTALATGGGYAGGGGGGAGAVGQTVTVNTQGGNGGVGY